MILPDKNGFFRPKNIEQLKELVSQKVPRPKIILTIKPYMEMIERIENLESVINKLRKLL